MDPRTSKKFDPSRLTDAYDASFYEPFRDRAYRSARAVVPLLCEWLPVRSVVDVGCGVCPWLAAFRETGVEDVLGIDGAHVDLASLMIPADCFREMDLTRPELLGRSFDLAISLEVGEHLPAGHAHGYVELITSLAPVVLFSAAIPGQEGVNHVNPQWPSYWHGLFAEAGYVALDPIRPRIWHDERVLLHYRQNIFVYARSTELGSDDRLGRLSSAPRANCLTLVDEDLLRMLLGARKSLKRIPGQILSELQKRGPGSSGSGAP